MVQKLGYFWPWWREGCLWLTREHYWCWDFVRKYNECLWVNEYGVNSFWDALLFWVMSVGAEIWLILALNPKIWGSITTTEIKASVRPRSLATATKI